MQMQRTEIDYEVSVYIIYSRNLTDRASQRTYRCAHAHTMGQVFSKRAHLNENYTEIACYAQIC